MNISKKFKEKVIQAIFKARSNYGGSDSDFAKTLGIKPSIYSRLKNGETDRLISDNNLISIARQLDVKMKEDHWKIAKTSVYKEIESNLNFCKEYSKSMILVSDCGIGKTLCTKHIIKNMSNAFYLDCSQGKTKQQFIRLLAKTIGVDNHGKYVDVKGNLKYYLNTLENPIIALDEAGDLDYGAFLELKELWNATDGTCAWYMIGADGLKSKVEKGIRGIKVGFAEIFSRFSDEFIDVVPNAIHDRKIFYKNLIGSVASANIEDSGLVEKLIRQCLDKDKTLRYLETLIRIYKAK